MRPKQPWTLALTLVPTLALGACTGALEGPPPVGVNALCTTPDVAWSPLRRLTRVEYVNSAGDLLGVDGVAGIDAVRQIARDERLGTLFSANMSSGVATVQVRQYLDAAEALAARVDVPRMASCAMGENERACAERTIARLGRRAYRRPLERAEVDAYLGLYDALRGADGGSDGGFVDAMQGVVEAMLQSPHFLYHLELADPATPLPFDAVLPAQPFAVASRLAFFLWSSGPDDALLNAAASGTLSSASGLRAEAERMLQDPRARATIASFHDQWLGLDRLDTATRDAALYPGYDATALTELREENFDFADHVIREGDGRLRTLLTGSYSFPRAAGLRSAGLTEADRMRDGRVELDPDERAGLLTQPAFLAAHAHSDQSSPILRGVALRERMFCQPLGTPPPTAVASIPEFDPTLTTRERFAAHRTSGTACQSCHSKIDDLGFALEHYDAVGAYRTTEAGRPIDATGVITQTDMDGDVDGAITLAERMSDSRQVRNCVATQWMRFAIARPEGNHDLCNVQAAQRAIRNDDDLRELLLTIATSPAMTHLRTEPEAR